METVHPPTCFFSLSLPIWVELLLGDCSAEGKAPHYRASPTSELSLFHRKQFRKKTNCEPAAEFHLAGSTGISLLLGVSRGQDGAGEGELQK